jgi:hypothetical protein
MSRLRVPPTLALFLLLLGALAARGAPPAEAGLACWKRLVHRDIAAEIGAQLRAREERRHMEAAVREYDGRYGAQPDVSYVDYYGLERRNWIVRTRALSMLPPPLVAVIRELKDTALRSEPEFGHEWGAFVIEYWNGEQETITFTSGLTAKILEVDILGAFDKVLEKAPQMRNLTFIHTHPVQDRFLRSLPQRSIKPGPSTTDLRTFRELMDRVVAHGGHGFRFFGIVAPLGHHFEDLVYLTYD